MLLSFIMRYRTSFNYQSLKPKTILLSYASPIVHYTFLAIPTTNFSPMSNLSPSLDSLAQQLSCPELDKFLITIRSKVKLMEDVKNDNYGFVDLHKI